MTNSKKPVSRIHDMERPHPLVAEALGNEAQPVAVRLGDLWSEFFRAAEEMRDPGSPRKASSAVPILDDMKGILQWD
jgi:hypothetical protein